MQMEGGEGHQAFRDETREMFAVHPKGIAGRDFREIRRLHHEGAKLSHLFFQEATGVVEAFRFQGIRANELAEVLGFVGAILIGGTGIEKMHLIPPF